MPAGATSKSSISSYSSFGTSLSAAPTTSTSTLSSTTSKPLFTQSIVANEKVLEPLTNITREVAYSIGEAFTIYRVFSILLSSSNVIYLIDQQYEVNLRDEKRPLDMSVTSGWLSRSRGGLRIREPKSESLHSEETLQLVLCMPTVWVALESDHISNGWSMMWIMSIDFCAFGRSCCVFTCELTTCYTRCPACLFLCRSALSNGC